MRRTIDKDNPGESEERQSAVSEQPANAKKVYRKPELSRYEQLHSIALGLH